jgi:hypothetical protein
MKNQRKLTANDQTILSCTFDSNNLSVKIESANGLLNRGINAADECLIDNKCLKNDIIKLKKLMDAATKLAAKINTDLFQSY